MNPKTFLALAEPNRLHIVEYLRDEPHSVNEIVNRLRLNQPQASKHLKVLSDAGLVDVRPQANKRYYQLRPEPLKEIDTWIQRYKKLWEVRFNRLDALLRDEKKLKKTHRR